MGKGKKNKNTKAHKGGPPKPEKVVSDQKSGNAGSNKRARKKKQQALKNYYNTAEDLELRESVEGDGTRTIIDMNPDGNCLFSSIADQLFYDYGQAHVEVRQEICDYLEAHESFFSLFLDLDDEETKGEDASDFTDYVHTMRQDAEWGGNLELVAAGRLYRRRIRVFSSNMSAMTIDYDSDKPPFGPELLVSYHDNDHYNSVRENSRGSRPPPPPKRTFVKQDFSPEVDEYTSDEGTAVMTDSCDTSNPPSTSSSTELSSEKSDNTTTTEPMSDDTGNDKAKKPVQATSPCPCGSGMKYKKCCKDKDRRETRRKRLMQQNGKESDEDDAVTQPPMEGKFRVLTI